jgi:hypothetical protein
MSNTLNQVVLEELVFEVVEQFDRLWEIVQRSLAALDKIDEAKRACTDDEDEQEALVRQLTDRAWERVAAQRALDRTEIEDRARGATSMAQLLM